MTVGARRDFNLTSEVSDFRPLNHNELDRLSSDELIAYLRAADAARDQASAERALGVLVFRHMEDVKRRCSIKVPRPDVEDVAMEAITSAIRSAFDERSYGQFRSWLNTIVDRRIADYHRRKESRPTETAYPEEHSDAEEIWGESGAVEDETGRVDVQSVIDSALASLNEVHRRVIELFIFEDLSAQETADAVNEELDGHQDLGTPMTVDNVSQIARRYRETVRKMLEEAQD